MQNVCGIKKWNYEKLPLNLAMQFPFPFPVIPGNNNVSFPFPKCGNGISIPVPKNWEWNFPVPKSWEWNFSFPFPFPKFGNGLSHSRSRSQTSALPISSKALQVYSQKTSVYKNKGWSGESHKFGSCWISLLFSKQHKSPHEIKACECALLSPNKYVEALDFEIFCYVSK